MARICLEYCMAYSKIFSYIYIYIYIYEMDSSYTWCNLTRVIPFVDRRFVIELMVKKIALNAN